MKKNSNTLDAPKQVDYRSLFLVRKISKRRRQTYVDADLLDVIERFLPVIAKDMSTTAFIHNVLARHIEQHKDEIKALYAKCSKLPF